MNLTARDIERAFLRACALDVAVRKPGNVSQGSPGHRMEAAQFLRSAAAAGPALCEPGAPVGRRIERAMRATWDAVGCNTNLGIVLLCAPLARAAELCEGPATAERLHQTLLGVLQTLDQDDAAAAFRAIALVQPGGLGRAPAQDVHTPPTVTLLDAMALAAERDRIALQYAQGFAELFALAPPAFAQGFDARAVQLCFLQWLRSAPDTHIGRKHGLGAAQSVQAVAQRWWDSLLRAGRPMVGPETDPRRAAEWAAWDETLKKQGLNPGTSADLTVAAAFLAGLIASDRLGETLDAVLNTPGGTERD